jgi:uncharacterized protein (DUF697 family)
MMQKKSRSITNMASGIAAATAFITQPVPVLDELAVIPIHYYLVLRLARERKVSIFKLPWRNIQHIVWYGAGARLLTHISLGLIPIGGGIANAITAVALTEYLSRYMDEALTDPKAKPPEISLAALRGLFDRAVAKIMPKQPAVVPATETEPTS